MRRTSLDELTAERLLAGRLAPEDAPMGWEHVALLVGVASGPAEEGELAGEPSIVSAMADAILGDAEIVAIDSRRPGFARLRTARVAGLAAAVVLLTATAAAAATDALPRPAQTAVSNAAAHVGVSLPKPTPRDDHNPTVTPTLPSIRPPVHGPSVGPASTPAAATVLCRAAGADHLKGAGDSSDGDAPGTAAAADHASVARYCQGVTHPTSVVAGHSSSPTDGGHHQNRGDGSGAGNHPSDGSGSSTPPANEAHGGPASPGQGGAGQGGGKSKDGGTSPGGGTSQGGGNSQGDGKSPGGGNGGVK